MKKLVLLLFILLFLSSCGSSKSKYVTTKKNNSNTTMIRYEDILKNPNSTLNEISTFFNLEKPDKVIMPEFSLSRNPEAVGKLPKQENKTFNKK